MQAERIEVARSRVTRRIMNRLTAPSRPGRSYLAMAARNDPQGLAAKLGMRVVRGKITV